MGSGGPAETQRSLAGARLLVVEDNFIILSGLEELFAKAGAEVIVSRTVQDAVVKADADISVAILEVALGSEIVEPVLARLAERGVPFFFHTGRLGTDELLAAWPEHKVITKPADAETLVAAVAALWSEKRTERRRQSPNGALVGERRSRFSAMAGFLMRRAADLMVKMRRKEPVPKGRKPTSL